MDRRYRLLVCRRIFEKNSISTRARRCPREVAENPESLQFGMAGIIGNALGFDHQPTPDEVTTELTSFSLRPLLDQDTNAPMLVINGADDVHVPQQDTLVFQGRRDTEVHLIPGTGHCAVSKWGAVIPMISEWLQRTLSTAGISA